MNSFNPSSLLEMNEASGGQLLSISSIFLMLLGITQLVSSGLVLDTSTGSDPGGLYVGVACFFVGLRGINPIDKSHIKWFFGFCIVSVIISIIGVILQNMYHLFVKSLQACMNKNKDVFYGKSNYYSSLSTCSANDPCTCIDDRNVCYSFTNYDKSRCFNILNSLPSATDASLNLTIVCLIFSVYLGIISFISWKRSDWLKYFNSTPQVGEYNGYAWWVKYMHFFPEEDDGVPFMCKHRWCPLDHRNKLTNDNSLARYIGPFGYDYFDTHRRFYLGMASMFTIFAMVITIWGCFALSTDRSIVQRTYWAAGTGSNITSNTYFSMYVGLRSLEYVDCVFVPGYNSYPSGCSRTSIEYSSDQCKSGPVSGACLACSNSASAMWLTAFMSCASMVLSLLGAQTRMRKIADVPVQKMMGMFSELWGAVSLAAALFVFQDNCFQKLHSTFNHQDLTTTFWVGPGLYCYAVCCISGAIRALVHWLTPLPHQGAKNFCFLCSGYTSRIPSQNVSPLPSNEESAVVVGPEDA